jgi:hypothetical protein
VLSDSELRDLASRLVRVPGVVGVMLGGSRARGTEHVDSDVDLGLYYLPPLDVAELRALAAAVVDDHGSGPPNLTEPGGWGPWVDGGGWLTIGGVAVDWIYRNLDRVQTSWQLAQQGEFSFHFQVGHPLGVPDFAYAGEMALGVVLADPRGELTRLKNQATTYPPKLTEAVVNRLTEAEFLLGNLAKSAGRADVALVAGTLFRVVGLCAHAIHAKSGRWVITEKGLIPAAAELPEAPVDFAGRARQILGRLGTEPDELLLAIDTAQAIVSEVRPW